MILVMTVEPGFGGQSMIQNCLHKVSELREAFPSLLIQVDGGITAENAGEARAAGANVIVAGTAIFGSSDPRQAIAAIRG
jgi:ribulose-phosphate 3-epimerase